MTTPERDLQAEEAHREFTGWAQAQGYDDSEPYDFDELEFAFTSGAEAERGHDAAAEVMRLRGVMERLADELEAEIAYLRETGVTRGNRDRQQLATRIREALDQAHAGPQPAPADALRDLLDHETRLTWQSGLPGERARVAVVRESAGLEAL